MLKPMSKEAWAAIIVMFLLIMIFVLASRELGGRLNASHKLTLVMGGVCCTILLSFYGGAQTMFLASETQPPFDTILEGLKYHQDWEFILPYGDENIFINLFAHLFNDPGMEWAFQQAEKFRNNPIDLTKALGQLKEGRYYVLTTSNRVTTALDDISLSAISVFCHSSRTPHSYMVPKNSPFKRAINTGLTRMRNIGVLKMLERMTRSTEEETKFAHKKISHKGIDLMQISLMLYAGVGIIVCVFFLVMCEKYLFKIGTSIGSLVGLKSNSNG